MKETKKTESLFVQWLQKIFTAQTITILIGLIGLAGSFYAYKTYKDTRPSLLSIEYDNEASLVGKGDPTNAEDIGYYNNLIWTIGHRRVLLGKYAEGGYNGQPRIINRTKKSISNFICKVTVKPYGLSFKMEDISPDYEVVRYYEEASYLELKYKYNTLAPWTALPLPIRPMYLPDSIPFSSDDHKSVDFTYDISYDGCEKPRRIWVRYYMFFDFDENEHHNTVTDKSIEWFFKYIYEAQLEGLDLSEGRFAIVDLEHDMDIKFPKDCSQDEFEERKKEFIKRWKKAHGIYGF